MSKLDEYLESYWGKIGARTDPYTLECMKAEFRRGFIKAIWLMEEWSGMNAYDADKGPCDEHSCDDSRGRNCSADEVMEYIKQWIC